MNNKQKHTYLTKLTRLCQTNPDNIQHLQTLLKTRLKSLALPAVTVASQTGDPIGKILAECLVDIKDYDLSEEIYLNISENSVSLVDVFTVVAKQLAENAEQNHPDDWLLIANTAEIYAKSLSHTGEHLIALEFAQKSVCIQQRHANLLSPQGLSSLSMYAECLMLIGELADTLLVQHEVVDGYQALTPLSPEDKNEYFYAYAHSLLSLSYYYKKLAKNNSALPYSIEALEITNNISDHQIEDVFLYHSCLRNLADTYDKIDHLELAERSINDAIISGRDLYCHAPDSYLLELVTTLEMSATINARLGKKDKAFSLIIEALEYIQKAYLARPEVFASQFASTHFNKANIHLIFNEIKLAHKHYNESIQVLERFNKQASESFDTLAGAINNRITIYFDLYRFEDAIRDAYRLLCLYRSKPEFIADLADTFNTLANCRIYNGEMHKALRSINTCIRYYKSLVDQGEDYQSHLAFSLASLSVIYRNMGRFECAIDIANEALAIMDDNDGLLVKAHPKAYCQMVITKIRCLIEMGELNASRKLADKQILIAKDDVFLGNELLAELLSIRSDIFIGLGDEAKAVSDISRAIRIYRNLCKDDIPSYQFDLARSLTTLCFLKSVNDYEVAFAHVQEAVLLFKSGVNSLTDELLTDSITALLYQGLLAHECDQDELAIESIKEVLSYQHQLLDEFEIQSSNLLPEFEGEHEFLLTLQELRTLLKKITDVADQSTLDERINNLEKRFNERLKASL